MGSAIDLNCDLGETVRGRPTADDAALFPLVTSANMACGFHAGDAESMRVGCERAARHGTALGAHVSYRDREGFGRRPRDPGPGRLRRDVAEQIAALAGAADAAGVRIRYVKPHGALYNRIAADETQAEAVAAACAEAGLPLLGLPGTAIARAAGAAGLPFFAEAFADRGYRADGTLAPRGTDGALVEDPREAASRAVRLAVEGRVTAIDGTQLTLDPASLCVHGDTPGSVEIARAVRRALADAGVRAEAFA